jgi:hypothetical protein
VFQLYTIYNIYVITNCKKNHEGQGIEPPTSTLYATSFNHQAIYMVYLNKSSKIYLMSTNNFGIWLRRVSYLMVCTPRMRNTFQGFGHTFLCIFSLVKHAKSMKGMRLHHKACQMGPWWNFKYFISILHNFLLGIQQCTLFLHLSKETKIHCIILHAKGIPGHFK